MSIDLTGSWINQNGSILEITETGAGHLDGVFTSSRGRASREKHFPVLGVANGEIVSFVVDFRDSEENLHSMTNFTGRYVVDREGLEQIHTIWVLARQFEDEAREKPTQVWNTFLVNSDVFTRAR
ncbi:MAG: avidin/streptavidin family protein [Pseudomonadales bacterium]